MGTDGRLGRTIVQDEMHGVDQGVRRTLCVCALRIGSGEVVSDVEFERTLRGHCSLCVCRRCFFHQVHTLRVLQCCDISTRNI